MSEVRPDGVEYLVQNGWLRLEHRAEDERRTDDLEVVHSFTAGALKPVRPGKWVEARVDIPSIGHPFRAGSQLRLTIATPGRNHATWEFENPGDRGRPADGHRGPLARRPSSLVLPVLPGARTCPRACRRAPACGARPAGPTRPPTNTPA